jgi:hypothetical protein
MTRSMLRLAVFLAAIVNPGCVAAPPSESVGSIEVPLTAPGANGATYRLPPDTLLVVASGMFGDGFPLDGDAPSLAVKLPPGVYGVSLFNPAGYSRTWPLTRENADGTTETVQATLLDLPPLVTVAEGQTTPLAIRFQVATAGPISFSHGTVLAFVEVDEVEATSFQFVIDAASLSTLDSRPTPFAPPELAPRLPTPGSTGQSYRMTAQTVARWFVASSDTACANVLAFVEGAGEGQWSDLLLEAQSADQAFICIQQRGPQRASIDFSTTHTGPAATPLLADLGDLTYSVSYRAGGEVAADVFDGATLHLSALVGARPSSISLFANIGVSDGVGIQPWLDLFELGDATDTMTPL